MCKTHNPRKIDKCMKLLIANLKDVLTHPEEERFVIRACCCGHGKYPMTIVVEDLLEEEMVDWCSDIIIPRKRKFYKKDKQGYYYIPETLEVKI